VGVVALWSLGGHAAFGQPVAQGVPNQNPYVNPQATAGRFANTAVLGKGLANAPIPGAAATGYGSLLPGAGPQAPGGYGTLSASYANPGGGYGSLNNSSYPAPAGFGQYGSYGLGYGTQWMVNPYEGYLRGAADVTRANADYQLTIQQARLVREEAHRSAIATRRAWFEEMEWERAHAPDPEKIRQQWLDRELNISRHNPPAVDIFSARSLNALLRHLIAQQGAGAKGPSVPLNDETLSRINLTVGDNRGNVGLLKDNANLNWPLPLQGEAFKDTREKLNSDLKKAFRAVNSGERPADNILSDLKENYKTMAETMEANLSTMTFNEQLEARRYLREYVKPAIAALMDPNVVNYFNGNWKANVKDVAQLVAFMREKGLWFAPATPTDEAAYRSLYYSLASFDAQMPRVASTPSDSQ
jgi:hypothetical protein